MHHGPKLRRAFFDRPSIVVAPELIGCVLVRSLPDDTVLAGRIVEVEAYVGDGTDPASHAHRGRTRRNQSMFGPPGHVYVYRIYGIHTCFNLVCGREGVAEAVLLRAVEPLEGVDRMRRLRDVSPDAAGPIIASGPGRLAQAFALELSHDGISALGGVLQIHHSAAGSEPLKIEAGPRVGITKAAELPYRFYANNSPFVSAFRAGGKAPRRRGGEKRGRR
jgi:DNA-3-methyladenine glycosylase